METEDRYLNKYLVHGKEHRITGMTHDELANEYFSVLHYKGQLIKEMDRRVDRGYARKKL